MPGRIMVLLVCLGAILGFTGLYQPFQDFAGAGASVPLCGFGNLLWKGVKEAVNSSKEYVDAINQLNQLLAPYKDELLKTEWGSRLFDENKIVTAKSIQSKGCACIYVGLTKDLEQVLSKEDYEKYMEIIEPIREIEREKTKKQLGL